MSDEHDEDDLTGRVCEMCGEPYIWTRKWNGGNPVLVELPTCDCEADAWFEDWLERRRYREAVDVEVRDGLL